MYSVYFLLLFNNTILLLASSTEYPVKERITITATQVD